MTSPVDTSVKFMTAEMSGSLAGVAGAAGSINNVLKAFLVVGWDTVSLVSLVVAGGIATATFPSIHSAVPESVVLIAGATPDDLNGEQKILTKSGTAVTFATSLPNGAATGAITMRMAPAGWDEVFTGTNTSVYRAREGNRMFLRVLDTGTVDARMIGYENMTAVAVGTGLFPTTAQMSGGVYWNKASAATALAAPYMILGDSRTFYFCNAAGFSQSPDNQGMYIAGFGEFASWKASADMFSSLLAGDLLAANWPAPNLAKMAVAGSTGLFCPRLHTGAVGSQYLDMLTETGDTDISGFGNRGPYPGLTDSLFLSRPLVSINKTTWGPRGALRGVWHLPQSLPIGTFVKSDLILGAGDTAGRKLMVIPGVDAYTTVPSGQRATLIDVTGPWPTT
jgi:hypothetical protein